ncbi:MAG: diaminopimelate epimerase [Burkholderiales bacterium]
MKIKFTKMQGVGNDFVVFDAVRQKISLDPEAVRRISDRHFGVGCDQILLIEPARLAGTDFFYRIFNSSGEEVEQCGNGARCFMRFVLDKGLTTKTEIRVETAKGVIVPKLAQNNEVTVDMGAPVFAPVLIPFEPERMARTYSLDVGGTPVEISALSMGNPHAVQVVANVDTAPVAVQGPLIERHARFPKGVNAGFMQIVDRHHIRLRVHERGAGETMACGTGACAAVVAGVQRGLLDSPVEVSTRGGRLRIAWAGATSVVMMTGPAETVFEGEIDL